VLKLVALASEAELELDGLFTQLSVEDGVLFFELGLPEDILDDGVQHTLIDLVGAISELVLLLIEINAFFFALFRGHETLEKEAAELFELLLEIVWSNDIEDQLDLLSVILVTLDLVVIGLSLLTQLSLLLVVLLLPGASRLVVVVLSLVGSTL
jgi:hypothetical protein